jgi:S1-C subfamily serine protease
VVHRLDRIARVLSVALLGVALCLIAPRTKAAVPPPPDLGWLGISIADVGEELADRLAATFGPDAGNGVLVVDVLKGGPAEQAALKRGDVIIKLDTQPIWDVRQLQRAVRAEPVRTQVALTILRESSQMTVPVTIGVMPAEARAQLAAEQFGFLVREADERDLLRDNALSAGKVFVAVVDADSPAARAGLRPLDVILQANDAPIWSLGDFDRAVRGSGRSIALRVARRGVQEPIALAVELPPK